MWLHKGVAPRYFITMLPQIGCLLVYSPSFVGISFFRIIAFIRKIHWIAHVSTHVFSLVSKALVLKNGVCESGFQSKWVLHEFSSLSPFADSAVIIAVSTTDRKLRRFFTLEVTFRIVIVIRKIP